MKTWWSGVRSDDFERKPTMMKICAYLVLFLCSVQGFQPPLTTFHLKTCLGARRVKRQSLGSIAEDGIVSMPKKVNKASTPNNKKTLGGQVSSDLATWAASQESGDAVLSEPTKEKSSTVAGFVPFDQTTAQDRRGRQSERLQVDAQRDAEVGQIVEELEEELENKNNLENILEFTKKLIQVESTPLKVLTASSSSRNYRLAWVGSDEAICHIGTGQHKLPLARLQEIFLTLEGRNRVQLYEVISLLGPFPNVRNTLQGSCQVTGMDPFNWKIMYDAMIDGLGNELLANKEGKTQQVDLQVYFCDQNAVVAVIPPKDGKSTRSDPLESNGANVLVFLREDDMDSKLEAMRVL